jgi:O-antigen ligase
MRNPVLGLGPAAYRVYAGQEPLPYRDALWYYPQISSHNNYVDIVAQFGLLGMGLFVWLAVTLHRHAVAVARTRADGFGSGYARGMVAVWVSTLVIMFLADWALPFVYNIGYEGFQASILVWLFMGGLVVLRPAPEAAA